MKRISFEIRLPIIFFSCSGLVFLYTRAENGARDLKIYTRKEISEKEYRKIMGDDF